MTSFLGLDYAAPARIDAIHDEHVTRDLGGRLVTRRIGTAYWRITMAFEPRAFADALPQLAVHRNAHGQTVPFPMPMPQLSASAVAGAITVASAAVAGTTSVSLASAARIRIPAGHFLTFGGHAKVYQVQASVDAAAPAEIGIFPELQQAVEAASPVDAAPNIQVVYESGSGGGWAVDRRNVVSPRIAVVET